MSHLPTHIAVVSVPVYSHLLSVLEFTKRLVQVHPHFHVTCMVPTLGSPSNTIRALLQSLPSNIDCILLPSVNLSDQPQGSHPAVLVQHTISRSLPSISEALKSLHSRSQLVALVTDGLITETILFAKELNLLSYIYFPSTAMLLSLCLYSSKLDETVSSEYRDLLEPIEIPGCVPVHGRDLPEPFQDRCGESYKEFLQGSTRIYLADGVLVNTFVEMEAGAIRALQEEGRGYPSVYPIGPVTKTGSGIQANGSECLEWLDKQAPKSVLYVSFGSGGTLSHDQIHELAWGLELSGKRFLWVFKPPSKFGILSDFGAVNEDPLHFLPSGFLERTKGQGLVIPLWAPQIEVLSHRATGGFVCHCGWNSALESVVHGVPLIAWPLFAEQKMNAAMLTKVLGVALRPKLNDKEVVEREEIAMVIKSLMGGEEGKQTRQRIRDLNCAALDALKENGSSTRTLSKWVLELRNFGGTSADLI